MYLTRGRAKRSIFTLYCGGASYNSIVAEMMDQGIPYYQKTNRWNKNMVSRILENERYIGAGGYPRLVSDSDFLSARLLRQTKTDYSPCPKEIQPVKEKTVCAVCGGRMKRDTKNGHPSWQCQNPECGCRIHLSDDSLLGTLWGICFKNWQKPLTFYRYLRRRIPHPLMLPASKMS